MRQKDKSGNVINPNLVKI